MDSWGNADGSRAGARAGRELMPPTFSPQKEFKPEPGGRKVLSDWVRAPQTLQANAGPLAGNGGL